MALVVLPRLAAHQQDAVVAARQGVGDPNHVDRPQAAHRDKADERAVANAIEARQVQGRIGIVFAQQAQQPRLLLEFVGHMDRFDHRGDDVHRIVFEGDDPFRASAHANPATAAAGDVGHGRALFVLIQCTEGALFGAPLALRTALEEEVRVRGVFPAGVHGQPPGGQLHALDGFQRRPGRVLLAGQCVVRRPHAASRIDPGAPRLVGETDEVRIGEAVLQHGHVRPLAVAQVQDVGALVALELLHGLLGRFQLGSGLALGDHRLGVAVLADRLAVGRHGHHPRGQHHQVCLDPDPLVDERLFQLHDHVAVARLFDRRHFALGKEDPRIFLGPAIKVLVLPRRPDVFVQHVRFRLVIQLAQPQRLLERHAAADGRAVGQVVFVA